MITIRGELPLNQADRLREIDVVLVACGYETRARAFAESIEFGEAEKVALMFEEQRVLAFANNKRAFQQRGFSIVEISDREVKGWVGERLNSLRGTLPQEEVRVFVDISSQSRIRLAAIIEALSDFGEKANVRAFFGYVPAVYAKPHLSTVPNVAIGPVSPFFAGWTIDPDLPVSLIIGLGYEPDRALGAVEYLEPAAVWALLPRSTERSYDKSLLSANAQLLGRVGGEQVLTYHVEDPNTTLAMLAALTTHLAGSSSVLLLPSGPKILVLLSLLLACDRSELAIWRVSAGADDIPIDRRPTKHRILIECEFTPGVPASTVAVAPALS